MPSTESAFGLRALALTMAMLTPLSACSAWREQPLGLEEARRQTLRLTLSDSSRFVLYEALLVGDSIVGIELPAGAIRSVPMQHIALVESNHFKFGKAAAFAVLVGLSASYVIFLLLNARHG